MSQQLLRPTPSKWRDAGYVDASALESELLRNVEGEVRFDLGSKAMYAVDSSNYRQVPIGVVIPKSKLDVISTIAACRKFGAPVLSRGGGTSLAGQCCNVAVVIDWSKYLNRILEMDQSRKYAVVEPGVVCDQLRDAARSFNLTWGPDPATHSHCSFGGMLGNNSCGAHAQMAGKAADNTEELEIVLYDGTVMRVGWMNESNLEQAVARGGREGNVYRHLRQLRDYYRPLIEKNFPRIPRRVSGYNLDELIPGKDGRFNVARALVGTESTCVTYLEAKVKLLPARAQRVVLMLGYPDIYQAADHLMEILLFNPIALEGMDGQLLKELEKKGSPSAKFLKHMPEGDGCLLVEFGSDDQGEAEEQARGLMTRLAGKTDAPNMRLYTDAERRQQVWALRESALGVTAVVPGQPQTWEGWEDSAVPPEKLGSLPARTARPAQPQVPIPIPRSTDTSDRACIHCTNRLSI
jgi:FAD/FMN-containing dehydrogenase